MVFKLQSPRSQECSVKRSIAEKKNKTISSDRIPAAAALVYTVLLDSSCV